MTSQGSPYITGYHFNNTACPGKFGFNSLLLKVLRYKLKTSSMTPIFYQRIAISVTRLNSVEYSVEWVSEPPQRILNGKVGKYAKNCCPSASLRLNSCQHEYEKQTISRYGTGTYQQWRLMRLMRFIFEKASRSNLSCKLVPAQ